MDRTRNHVCFLCRKIVPTNAQGSHLTSHCPKFDSCRGCIGHEYIRKSKFFDYSPGQANLQFSLSKSHILCEIKFGNLRRYETVILVILIFGGIPHLKVLRMLKFSLSDTQILREIKFGNIRR